MKVEPAGAGAWSVVEARDAKDLTRILRRPDGRWQVWPAWGQSPFSRIAAVTVAVAETLGAATGAELQFDGRAYDATLRSEVRSRVGGLGVDFYVWTQEHLR